MTTHSTQIVTSIAFQVSLFKTLDTQTEVLNRLFHLYRRSYLFGQIYFKKCTALRKHVSSITQLCEKRCEIALITTVRTCKGNLAGRYT